MGYTFDLFFKIVGAGVGVAALMGASQIFHWPKIGLLAGLIPAIWLGAWLGTTLFHLWLRRRKH